MPVLLADLRAIMAHEANPALRALADKAEARGLDRLLDDDWVTFGHGAGAVTWAIDDLPAQPDWTAVRDIPLALVTGCLLYTSRCV